MIHIFLLLHKVLCKAQIIWYEQMLRDQLDQILIFKLSELDQETHDLVDI